MGGKNLNVAAVIFLVILLGFVSNAAKGKEQVQEEVESQKEQLEKTEKYILRAREEIEDYYTGALVEVRLRGEKEIGVLEVANKGVYSSLAAQAEIAKAVLEIHDYGWGGGDCFSWSGDRMGRVEICENKRPWILRKDLRIVPKHFAAEQVKIAEAKSGIQRKFGLAAVALERQKRYALNVGLAELEKRLKENVVAAKPKATRGVVSGIVYSEDRPLIIIDGKIAKEGDFIHGVKVSKIHRGKVEFEKAGQKWEQTVQEERQAFWE